MSAYDELIAPISAAELTAALRSREIIFRRTGDAQRFSGLLNWQSFSTLILDGSIPPPRLRFRTATMAIPPAFWREGERVNPGKFADLVRSGISIIATALHEHVPSLQSLCQAIASTTRDRIRAGAIVTTGAGGALPCHYDPEDLIVLQVEGAKRWRIYGPPQPRGPGERTMSPPAGSEPVFDDVLRAGDILVLPGGYPHHCENQPGISMHLGIAFNPLTGFRAARNLLRELRKDQSFWTALDRFESAEQRAKHEELLKARWVDLIRHADLLELAGETEAAEEPANIYDT
jgi:Cupin superfamily protein